MVVIMAMLMAMAMVVVVVVIVAMVVVGVCAVGMPVVRVRVSVACKQASWDCPDGMFGMYGCVKLTCKLLVPHAAHSSRHLICHELWSILLLHQCSMSTCAAKQC